MNADPQAEQTFLQTADVLVTNKRAVINKVTYALPNITSVRPWHQPRPRNFLVAAALWFLVGIFLLMSMRSSEIGMSNVLGVLFGGVFIGGYYLNRPLYGVTIATAGLETNSGLKYRNRGDAEQVIEALNKAIVSRV